MLTPCPRPSRIWLLLATDLAMGVEARERKIRKDDVIL